MTLSTAREGAVSITDKYGNLIVGPYWPAVFDGKQLVQVSSCELHPKFQALRKPRSEKAGCTCAEIYSRRND